VNRDELLKAFPGISRDCLIRTLENKPVHRTADAESAVNRANRDAIIARILARQKPEPKSGQALVRPSQRKGPRQERAGSGGYYRIKFVVHATQPRDWDNLSASVKQIQDAIVEAGWLPDDDWKTLEGTVVSAKATTEEEERTEVTIERMK
jgi:hypothetical protein